ncbi:hypothetical protein LIER_11606 [Lithospermum erythrorhizon]|uniref:Uncharacterized protein n=1 Tax=Lithospermum erythrorhizon TaxID=34254 RepID=A0AAV3PNP3_LITER
MVDAREASEVYKTELERWKKHSRGLEAEIEDHQFHIIEAQNMLKGYYDKVGAMETYIRAMKAHIGGLQRAMGVVEEYCNLLKGDIATLLRSFCQSLLEELPKEEEPTESEDTFESDSGDEEGGDES